MTDHEPLIPAAADGLAPLIAVAPRPHEIALARVPAGTRLCFPLRAGFSDVKPAADETTWAEVPGQALTFWGADLTTRYSAHAIGLYRRAADRPVWRQAARLLAGDPLTPAVVYVLLIEQTGVAGRRAWLADSIREENPSA